MSIRLSVVGWHRILIRGRSCAVYSSILYIFMSGLDVNVADQMIVNEIDILDERVEFMRAMS